MYEDQNKKVDSYTWEKEVSATNARVSRNMALHSSQHVGILRRAHNKLAHHNVSDLCKMAKDGMVDGLDGLEEIPWSDVRSFSCSVCLKMKPVWGLNSVGSG